MKEHEEKERCLAVEVERLRTENYLLKQDLARAKEKNQGLENDALRMKENISKMQKQFASVSQMNKSKSSEYSKPSLTKAKSSGS